jgi:adenosine deaminase
MEKRDTRVFKEFLTGLDKTEIHLHLEALASADSIWALMTKNALHVDGVKSKSDLIKKFNVTNLDEFLFLFINIIQSALKTEDDFKYLIDDAADYLLRNNIVYAEIFFAPTKFLQNGLDFKKIVDVLTKGANEIKKKHKREIKFIVDVSRSFGADNAMRNLCHLLENKTSAFIGIGLGGAEAKGPAEEFSEVYKKAFENKLHCVVHAGEDVGPQSILQAINSLKTERIGHCISAIEDDALLEHLRKTQIPLEICPTSNLFTRRFVQKIEDHPVRAFFDRGLNVTINSDDPTLFSTSLVDEYALLYKHGIFNKDEIVQLIKNGIYATFLSKAKKDALWAKVQTQI